MKKKLLYRLTSSEFRLPSYQSRDGVIATQGADNIPMVSFPDGSWCFEANAYLLKCYDKGLSRKHDGGTLADYALDLSPLLRYAFFNKIRLNKFTDADFTFFIKTLSGERSSKMFNAPKRSANTVLDIGRTSLSFLQYVGELYSNQFYVSPDGSIRAEKKEFVVGYSKKNGRPRVVRYWHHNSFPRAIPDTTRVAISYENIELLREAASRTRNPYMRRRRLAMIKLLELTGGRRAEICAITLQAVHDAANAPKGRVSVLAVPVLKGVDRVKHLPISKHDAQYLLDYLFESRRTLIRKRGFKNAADTILISTTTGGKLRPNTITQEIHILAKIAGIEEQTCPHMFRHRFITDIVKFLIEQHGLETAEDIRKALVSIEAIKIKVLEWTGHAYIDSLETYVHLAQGEIANMEKSIDLMHLRKFLLSAKGTFCEHKLNLRFNPAEVIELSSKLIDRVIEDIDRYNSKHAAST